MQATRPPSDSDPNTPLSGDSSSTPPNTAAPRATKSRFGSDFRTFFLRGLAIVLPTVLTIWLLTIAYSFVNTNFAGPINAGVREGIIRFSSWPEPTDADFLDTFGSLAESRKDAWDQERTRLQKHAHMGNAQWPDSVNRTERLTWMKTQNDLVLGARRRAFKTKWNSVTIGHWAVFNLIGIILAVILIYIAGLLVTSFIGRRFYRMGENLIARVPLIRNVYPAVKQVTDFLFGSSAEEKLDFNRVVAVQYPRKGIWSVGMVTGETMAMIELAAGETCLTVFIPSSPTPFTGYVITVPKSETVDLPITVEDALKFAVSGGVVIPANQVIKRTQPTLPGFDAPASSSASPHATPVSAT
ncbi:MAG: DUF502 domain-containing protein [Algisphaera sp.]